MLLRRRFAKTRSQIQKDTSAVKHRRRLVGTCPERPSQTRVSRDLRGWIADESQSMVANPFASPRFRALVPEVERISGSGWKALQRWSWADSNRRPPGCDSSQSCSIEVQERSLCPGLSRGRWFCAVSLDEQGYAAIRGESGTPGEKCPKSAQGGWSAPRPASGLRKPRQNL